MKKLDSQIHMLNGVKHNKRNTRTYRGNVVSLIISVVNNLSSIGFNTKSFKTDGKIYFKNINEFFSSDDDSLELTDKQFKLLNGLFKLMKLYPFEEIYHKGNNPMISLGKYDIDFVLDNFITPTRIIKQIDGVNTRTNHDRYKLFKQKGTTCVSCGLQGEFFILQNSSNEPSNHLKLHHFNLYGIRDNENILMTIDHIIPRHKGGANDMSNYQTMCFPCNAKKGSE